MRIRVEPVAGRAGLRDFIRLPLRLYRDEPCYVPHLLSERRRFFSAANPLFEFTDVARFLARDERGRAVGRVTAHVNRRHNEFHGERTGFFGFFECVDDAAVAEALMAAAEARLREQGMTAIRGPFNFSTNEECGFLARGFDRPPAIMMPYTPPRYLDLMRDLGYAPARDLLAYDYAHAGAIPEHFVRFGRRVLERAGVTVRRLDMARFEEDVATTFRLYNAAWERNWGFVPVTEAEFHYAAHELRPIIDPAIVLIAEKDGEPIGFAFSLPDYNIVLRRMRGRLLPFGWLRFLLGRRSINRVRVLLLGLLPPYRRSGLDVALYHATYENGLARGYYSCEMSWILEDNAAMRKPLERMGATVGKVYRIFEKPL